jgi:hypothetical protein
VSTLKRHLSCSSLTQDEQKPLKLSRRAAAREKSMKLYVFPSFHKCDSLANFPSSFARCLNSGDFVDLTKLFSSYVDKDCAIKMNCGNTGTLTSRDFVSVFEIADSLHPDSVACVHSTKVEANIIASTMYFKFTDNQFLNQAVARSIKGDMLPEFREHRKIRYERHIGPGLSSKERRNVDAILGSDEDIVVYGTTNFNLKVDPETKKIVNIEFISAFSKLVVESGPSVCFNFALPPMRSQLNNRLLH